MSEQFALGIKTSVYNNEVRKRRLNLGMTQKQLGEICGLSGATIAGYERFGSYPSYDIALKIAQALDSEVGVLFPQWLKEYKLAKSSVDKEVMIDHLTLDNPEVMLLEADNNIENSVDNELLKKQIELSMSTLTDREKKIISLRFGLNGEKSMTLDEVAVEFSVTRERIRQIEAKILAKMRKNQYGESLRKFLS